MEGTFQYLARVRRSVCFTLPNKGNTYPGCGSDIPGHWYSLSRKLNPHWSTYYPGQREIRAYSDAVWAQHGLQAHTRFGTEVVRATWDAHTHSYTVALEDVVSRARRTVTARVVISAAGGFMAPRMPEDVPGTETFQGDRWHSAEWQHDVPLAGKRVGVIGNGCSAYVIIVRPLLLSDGYCMRTRTGLGSCFCGGAEL
jgi:cation diffusion facilitator CzcD-associated flavoprotein CzcO